MRLRLSAECRVVKAEVIAPSQGEVGFVQPFCKVIMKVSIIHDRSGDRVLAKCLGFRQPTMPLLGRNMALTIRINAYSS